MSRILTIGFLIAVLGSVNAQSLFAQQRAPYESTYGNMTAHREPPRYIEMNPVTENVAPKAAQNELFAKKVFPIPQHVSPYEIRERLTLIMPQDLRKYAFLHVDPQRNELHVQGPKAAVIMAEQCLPHMFTISPGIEVGTLPPIDEFTFHDRWSERLNQEDAANEPQPVRRVSTASAPTPTPRSANVPPLTAGKVFRCSVENLRDFEKEIHRRFGTDPTINYIFEDERESRTLSVSVIGSEDKVFQFGKTLYQMGVLLPEERKETESEKQTLSLEDPAIEGYVKVRKAFTVKNLPFNYVTAKLRQSLGERLAPLPSSPSTPHLAGTPAPPASSTPSVSPARFEFTASEAPAAKATYGQNPPPQRSPQRKLVIEFRPEKKQLYLDGDKQVCDEMIRLIEAIDTTPSKEVERKIIRLRRSSARDVRKTVDAYVMERRVKLHAMAQSEQKQRELNLAAYREVSNSARKNPQSLTRNAPEANDRPVRRTLHKPQEGVGGGLSGGSVEPLVAPGGAIGEIAAPGGLVGPENTFGGPGEFGNYGVDPRFGVGGGAGSFMGSGLEVPQSLNILPLPLLDIILFEGSGAEFKRLSALIEDIERLLQATESQLKLITLRHTDCVSMNEMLVDIQLQTMLLNTRKGQVFAFPMRNPNAILLVGWGSALDRMEELIKALDKPIAKPGSRWKAFQLRYASATLALTTVRTAFPAIPNVQRGEPGYAWEPRLRLVADVRTNTLIVFGGPNDLLEVEELIRQIDLFESGPEVRVQRFDMVNSLASDVAQTLTSILSPGTSGVGTTGDKFPQFVVEKLQNGEKLLIKSGLITDFKIEPDPRHNKLFVTAPEYALPLIAELIRLIDTPMPTVQAKLFQLQNGDAKQVVQILESIFPSQIQAGQLNPMLAGSEGEDNFVPMRFGTDTRTNTIIAIGSQGDLFQVTAMINRLDSSDVEDRQQKIVQLKNATAARVATTLNNYLTQKTQLLQGFASVNVKSPYLQYEEAMVVVPETSTNSLLIEATPRYIEVIEQMIKEMDRAPDQVVIQVLIAEVTCSNANELGAEFGFQDPILFNRSTFDKSTSGTRTTTTTRPDGSIVSVSEPAYVPAGNGTPGFLFNENPSNSIGGNLNSLSAAAIDTVAPQILSNFSMGRVGSETGFSGMVFSASSDSVSILIRALEEKRRIEILSRPQIMAMDGQLAFILVGQRVPRVAGSDIGTTTTSAKVDMEEVGLMLMVTPRISPDGKKVVMNIGAEKSSVGAVADGIPIPDGSGGSVNSPKINAITTKTDISAANNETVVLGGLITKNTTEVQRKVPFLGDIPVLGRLFQYNMETMRREELLIILTPRVIRSDDEGFSEDAARIKREEAARVAWCLRDVVQLHGSPSLDLGIYHATAEQPVTGPTQTVYPTPVLLDELQPLNENAPTPDFTPTPRR